MSEYVILLDDGNSVTITADSCEWDSDTITFFDTDNYYIAMFKMEHVIGYFKKLTGLIKEDKI